MSEQKAKRKAGRPKKADRPANAEVLEESERQRHKQIIDAAATNAGLV